MKTLYMLILVLGIQASFKHYWPIIGIDLGTKNSCVGIFRNGNVEIIPNEEGKRKTPSVVAFTDKGLIIGKEANNQAIINPSRTLYNIKRLMGRKFADPSVQNDRKFMPYEIVELDDKPQIMVQNIKGFSSKMFAPEEISAMVLMKMKEISETYLKREVENAVITVPAYFNNAQRQATKDAGAIAGLNVVRILNEPTAAAIAYGFSKRKLKENLVIFDLGGGTYDVSIVSIDDGDIQVIATSGITNFGGEDFDQRLIGYLIKVIYKKINQDISGDKRAIQKLKKEVVKAKIALSVFYETKLDIQDLVDGFHFQETLKRSKFEDLNADLFNKLAQPFILSLKDSKLTEEEISEIILIGGSTRIPKVRQIIEGLFSKININSEINPEEAVCQGAAIQGAIISGESKEIEQLRSFDVTPFSLGIEYYQGEFIKIIEKGSIPQVKSERYLFEEKLDVISVYESNGNFVKGYNELGSFCLDKSIFSAKEEKIQHESIFSGGFFGGIISPLIFFNLGTPLTSGSPECPKIEFFFQVGDDGILYASANCKKSEKVIFFDMKHPGLSEEEIRRMQQFKMERVDKKIEDTNSIYQFIQKIYDLIKYPPENQFSDL